MDGNERVRVSVLHCTRHIYPYITAVDELKEDGRGKTCSLHGIDEKCIPISCRKT